MRRNADLTGFVRFLVNFNANNDKLLQVKNDTYTLHTRDAITQASLLLFRVPFSCVPGGSCFCFSCV